MKTIFTSLTILLCIATSAQTIRRVNNNPGITGTNIYTTIQAAHDAAVNGDIIYVEPSTQSYGDLVCSKNLRIVGVGYFLSENQIYPSFFGVSTLNNVAINPGSDNTILTGLTISSLALNRVNNITIDRNRINGFFATTVHNSVHANISGITITRNFMTNLIQFTGSLTQTTRYVISNVILRNNVFGQMRVDAAAGLGYDVSQYQNFNISNNIITLSINSVNATVQNNIFINMGAAVPPIEGSIFNSTLTNNSSALSPCNLPGGNGNECGINLTTTFSNFNLSTDKRYELASNSPAKSSGTNGVDRGIFGGTEPYVISGIPSYPTITSLITTGTGSNTTPLSVTISTKSNN